MCACMALTSAQFGHYDVDFSDFGTSFGAPTYNNFAAAARDPRANPGKGIQGFKIFLLLHACMGKRHLTYHILVLLSRYALASAVVFTM